MKTLSQLVRPNIFALKPYSCARSEFKGEAKVFLDANENYANQPYNRYPDPLQLALKEKIARLKGVQTSQIMLGNGSDEPIDLIVRIFCEPKEDNIVAIDPTYGMYQVCADVNNVEYRKVKLGENFTLQAANVLAACDQHTKVVFLCSPNNPTGNLLCRTEVRQILQSFDGIVVIDEAYIDFADTESWLQSLAEFPNLIVLQTFSKAWGLASLRCGMAFASEEIIGYFNKVKYPYNLNILTQQAVSEQLDQADRKAQWVSEILASRAQMAAALQQLPLVKQIYASEANFLLVRVDDACAVYNKLVERGIIVRNRHSVSLCQNCLRITIGSNEENNELIEALKTL